MSTGNMYIMLLTSIFSFKILLSVSHDSFHMHYIAFKNPSMCIWLHLMITIHCSVQTTETAN